MSRGRKILNGTLTAVFIISLVLFILTLSIAVPIYCRFLYYIQINTLNLPEKTGYTYEVIKEAYDNCLDFCTLPWVTEFSTYPLAWTEDEAAHFADCKVLFMLDFWALICSGFVSLALALLNKFKVIVIFKLKGHGAYFYSAIIAVALPVVLIILVLIVGFDSAFKAFHAVFFPGKTNWVFNSKTEQIINVMPEEFFMNCAIIIAVFLIALSAALITLDLVLQKRRKKIEKCG